LEDRNGSGFGRRGLEQGRGVWDDNGLGQRQFFAILQQLVMLYNPLWVRGLQGEDPMGPAAAWMNRVSDSLIVLTFLKNSKYEQ